MDYVENVSGAVSFYVSAVYRLHIVRKSLEVIIIG